MPCFINFEITLFLYLIFRVSFFNVILKYTQVATEMDDSCIILCGLPQSLRQKTTWETRTTLKQNVNILIDDYLPFVGTSSLLKHIMDFIYSSFLYELSANKIYGNDL